MFNERVNQGPQLYHIQRKQGRIFEQIIHASSEDIAIVPSAGFAMTMIAHIITS